MQTENTSNAKCKIRSRLKTCARDECTGRCNVTNTDRSPKTLPQSQKPLRIWSYDEHYGLCQTLIPARLCTALSTRDARVSHESDWRSAHTRFESARSPTRCPRTTYSDMFGIMLTTHNECQKNCHVSSKISERNMLKKTTFQLWENEPKIIHTPPVVKKNFRAIDKVSLLVQPIL